MRRLFSVLAALLLAISAFGVATAAPGHYTACENQGPQENNWHCQDDDGDGWANHEDNCPDVHDPSNECAGTTGGNPGNGGDSSPSDECDIDTDGDGLGECADDDDGDGISNPLDNCRKHSNVLQEDTDEDGRGDACDSDDDNDGIPDVIDNCQYTHNPGQEDGDLDGTGNACDYHNNLQALQDAVTTYVNNLSQNLPQP